MDYLRSRAACLRLVVVLATVALVLEGCFLFASNNPAPPDPLRPTIVGVVAKVTPTTTGWSASLVDGRTVDEPKNATFRLMGGGDNPGSLLLVGDAGGGVAFGLPPTGDGCWGFHLNPGDMPIAWDMGDSILFSSGLELTKASAFQAHPTPLTVDERLVWVAPGGDQPGYMNFCINDKGEVASGDWPYH